MATAAEVTELDSGLRVVTEAVPSVRSVAAGIWVDTGSRRETPEEAGVSHFLEHLLFKGTARYGAVEISELFDGMGASVNAATGKETTQLHARFLDKNLGPAFDLMAEMFLEPTYPEIDSEREVVIEEIAMYEDEPSDRVHDYLAEALFGNSPLGKRVLGSADVIKSIPVSEIREYHDKHYRPERIVVSAAGNVEHDVLVALVERHMKFSAGTPGDANGSQQPDGVAEGTGRLFREKDTEQFHICLGGRGLPRGDDRRYVMAVLDSILGGSTSSRLFREIREKRGLAYAVGTYHEAYSDSGIHAAYVGTRPENVEEAISLAAREMQSLARGDISAAELDRSRENVKGRLVLSSESTLARMSRNGRSLLFDLPLESVDEMVAGVDAVSLDDLVELATELYGPGALAIAAIGSDRDRFTRAVDALAEADA